jgi:hypothetical protein
MSIDWSKLVAQGRAKAYGISWNEEESKALYVYKIPADYVRQGVLTLEEYEKALKQSPIKSMSKEELIAEAKKKGIATTPEATKESLKEVLAVKKPKLVIKKPIKKVIRKK